MYNIKKYLLIFILIGISFYQEKESIADQKKLAEAYVEAGLYDDALIIYKNILNIQIDILGEFHKDIVPNLYDLHNICNNQGPTNLLLPK